MTNDKFNARATLVSKQVVNLRLASSIRTATAVLATSQDTIVLWTSDANMNGVPNLSELRLIRYKPSTSEIIVYQASTTPAIDTAYTLADDYLTIASNLIAANSLPPTVILNHVAAWNIALDNANAKLARLARVRVTTSTPGGPETSTVIAALKCSRSP
jgi:hypothetical protein